jgi:hypothetical protein
MNPSNVKSLSEQVELEGAAKRCRFRGGEILFRATRGDSYDAVSEGPAGDWGGQESKSPLEVLLVREI